VRLFRTIGLLVIAALCLGLAPAAEATLPGANGKIVFWRASNLYTINPDGTGETQLTTSGDAGSPKWSPDGHRIALARTVGGNTDVYTIDADGSNMTRLTTNPAVDTEPAWSPDGRIAFVTWRDATLTFGACQTPCNWEIYTMSADGSNQTRLTNTVDQDESNPDWSPDGTKIAFVGETVTGTQTNTRIYTINADGSDQRQLTAGSSPSWSPEANRIAFVAGTQTSTFPSEIWTMNPDGTGAVQVTQLDFREYSHSAPVWSPNAGQIAGSRISCQGGDCLGARRIFVVNANGGAETEIATGISPDWQRIPQPDYGYARPRGATPFRAFFTPAYTACTAPNRTHGAPLAFPSCAPPLQTSLNVTAGTPDANGASVNFIGESRLSVVSGDVKVAVTLSDIRCTESTTACTGGTLSDYTGPMRLEIPVRLTDAYVKGLAATSEGSISVPVPCSPTAASNVGSACAVDTTVNSVVPGAVRAGNRAIWQLGQLQIWDSGQDGLLSTRDDDTLFATEGVFIP
jgi:Tol biopolymer transport system component